MVVFRILLVIGLLGSFSAQAEENGSLTDKLLTRTEYTNKGLLNGINYNVWWYRAFSLGTSWNGPENMLSKIHQRAERSPEDAQELLVELSRILTDQEPAGDYITELYGFLFLKSQMNGPMEVSTLRSLLKDRGLIGNANEISSFDYNDSINKLLLGLVLSGMSLPEINLDSSEDFEIFERLLSIYLHTDINGATSTDNIVSLVNLVLQNGSEQLKIKVADQLFSIRKNSVYFSNSNSDITERAKLIFDLRKRILVSLPVEKRKEIVLEKIQGFRLSSNNYESYFSYKKIENDLLILEEIGGKEALMLVAEKIEQIVDLLESIDKEISQSLSRISLSVGYSSRGTSRYVGNSYLRSSGGISSQDAASAIRAINLRGNTLQELREAVQMSIDMCNTAFERNDAVVLEACANDLVSKLMTKSRETTASDAKAILNQAVNTILARTSDYFRPENFQTSCTEIDLEKGLVDTQNALKEIEKLKVRIPENYVFHTEYGVNNTSITQFMFVDCSNPEFSVLVSPRNMTYADYGEGADLENVFFVDSSTVASCIRPNESQLSPDISRASYVRRITSRSVGLLNYLQGVTARYWDSLGSFIEMSRYREDNSTKIELSEEEKIFRDFFTIENGSFANSNPTLGRRGGFLTDENTFSGQLLPEYLKKVCVSHSRDQAINCKQEDGGISCKENSLFHSYVSPK